MTVAQGNPSTRARGSKPLIARETYGGVALFVAKPNWIRYVLCSSRRTRANDQLHRLESTK